MNAQIADNLSRNMLQRFYMSRTFDFFFGLILAAIFGILGVFAVFYDVTQPALVTSLVSPLPENTILLRTFVGVVGFMGIYGCISLYFAAILRQKMSRSIRKYSAIGLWCGLLIVLLWVLLNMLTILQLPTGLPDIWGNIFSISLAVSVMVVSVKYIKMLRNWRHA